jgi:D-alanyl-lipoteichoic acid acyltransferase DltB (MBOAT superfamily)
LPFISFSFLFLFLPISLVFHFLAARFGERVRLCALIAASFSFYAVWDIRAAAVLGCSIVVNYGIGRLIEQARDDEHAFQAGAFLTTGIALNLGVLAVFRYADFLVGNIEAISGTNFVVGKILAPLGVLFFSCDQIAYLVDIRRGKKYGADFLRYAAFVSFFPRLVGGPLLRYAQIEPQLTLRKPEAEDFAIGLTSFVIGLVKVLLLAGAVAPFATIVFFAAESGQPVEFFAAWTGVFAFACQIYFDLSGYADMAIGLGRCFGLVLPINFRSPYRAANIADFWRRWNITLSDFLRDYVYLPLGGNRHGTARAALNLVIAMVLGGLWYGAGGMFVAWALLHAFYVLSYRTWRAFCARSDVMTKFRATRTVHIMGIILTFLAVTLSWIVFRSTDSATGLGLFAALSGQYGAMLPSGVASLLGPLLPLAQTAGIAFSPADSEPLTRAWVSIAVCLGVIFLLPNTEALLSSWQTPPADDDREAQKIFPLRWLPSSVWSMALGVLGFICLASLNLSPAFLHWRF